MSAVIKLKHRCVLSGSADASSDNKGGAGNVVSGSGDNTVHNAGEINNSSEEKLKGTLELQIFVGGYGSECWEYAISEFQAAAQS